MNIELVEFVDWAFKGIIMYLGKDGIAQFKKLRESVTDLNTKIAVLIEKDMNKEKILDKHDERISKLEDERL